MSSRPSRGAARLAAILDALPDALLLVNANGTVVNANSIALETFETPGTALVGRGLLDLLPSFDSRRIPGSMRRPEPEEGERTKPTRMIARRTDGSEFPVEVTSANLEDSRTAYADPYGPPPPYTGDELLMLVVRDLTGTLDTEAELARQQRQTEMILRAASEGVVGIDTEGKVVLVNPAAAQILGFRASDLGGQQLHPLVQHSRADGSPLPFEETALASTLASGRKIRVRGQVLWTKDSRRVPVDLTTAPVREGDQLVGAVMTFTDRSRYDALAGRYTQLRAVLDTSLRGPLEELKAELSTLASDPAGQLWPEANQILHHLAAGYARMTTLIDNVLAFQQLDSGEQKLDKRPAGLDAIVAAGVEGAVELIGPGRAQYAVHAPPVQVTVDADRLAQAIAHLIADVAGVDATGTASVVAGGGDSTIVVAAAKRGDVVRIEVRGPHSGGDPVHLPITRGIVERHGGVLQTHQVPGQNGSAYVLEVPVGEGGATPGAPAVPGRESETTVMPVPNEPVRGTRPAAEPQPTAPAPAPPRPRRPMDDSQGGAGGAIAPPAGPSAAPAQPAADQPTGRRRALHRAGQEQADDSDGGAAAQGTSRGRRARRPLAEGGQPEGGQEAPARQAGVRALPPAAHDTAALRQAGAPRIPEPRAVAPELPPASGAAPGLRPAGMVAPAGPAPALPPAPAGHDAPDAGAMAPVPAAPAAPSNGGTVPGAPVTPQSPPLWQPVPGLRPQEGRPQRSDTGEISVRTLGQGIALVPPNGAPGALPSQPGGPSTPAGPGAAAAQGGSGSGRRRKLAAPGGGATPAHATAIGPSPAPAPEMTARADAARPHPAPGALGSAAPGFQHGHAGDTRGGQQPAAAGHFPGGAADSDGRAFAIGAPAEGAEGPEPLDGPNGVVEVSASPGLDMRPATAPRVRPDTVSAALVTAAIGAPTLLNGPRRLLVWPEPDVSTRQALADRGYRPVTVRSREEVDAQVAEYPAALFVDPLTGPITRTALQSLRTAAVAAEVPVLVTAGLGQATREAAYGADPAVLLKALAPRDSEQHPPRVLLVEAHQDIATAFTASLERRGMQVAHALSEEDAAALASQLRPNLVVMDLLLVSRERLGIIDWLRANGLLNRTPLVVYTSVDIDPAELPRLGSGETVLFLAERSTSTEVQERIVDLLSKIGTELQQP